MHFRLLAQEYLQQIGNTAEHYPTYNRNKQRLEQVGKRDRVGDFAPVDYCRLVPQFYGVEDTQRRKDLSPDQRRSQQPTQQSEQIQ